ncbi:hypothetical protein [Gloeothece citriformis]|nr:hypothetical protein [Gloeothece citriformis]
MLITVLSILARLLNIWLPHLLITLNSSSQDDAIAAYKGWQW